MSIPNLSCELVAGADPLTTDDGLRHGGNVVFFTLNAAVCSQVPSMSSLTL